MPAVAPVVAPAAGAVLCSRTVKTAARPQLPPLRAGQPESRTFRAFASATFAASALAALRGRAWRRAALARHLRPSVAVFAEGEKSSKEKPGLPKPSDARAPLLQRRLESAEYNLQVWSYVAEVVYTWLGIISLGVAGFSFFTHGKPTVSMLAGLSAVGLSSACQIVGWWQARGCRAMSRGCGLAAAALEPLTTGVAAPTWPPTQLLAVLPALGPLEKRLWRRERTAWLGLLFAVLGLHTMVGMLVTKVLTTSGGITPLPGLSLDVFTLLAVSNCALSHVLGGGIAAMQRRMLPAPSKDDTPVRGWDR
mmetsp:Transcript_68791/g.149715  ORF Transcript_68791/g.149715 Transcript_68791/m.149715 type:complete len:308 (+) Transcript_68791:53-976(+)